MENTPKQGGQEASPKKGSAQAASPKKRKRGWNYPRKGLGPIHRWIPSWRFVLSSIFAVFALGTGFLVTLYITTDIPEPDEMALAQTTRIYYSDGETEMGSFADVEREPVGVETLPDWVGHAVIASEDKTFYTNNGIDLRGLARALVNNARGGARQGGSTLTQQYVERYYLGTTTSYAGKLKEAIIAVKIDREQTKEEILENYLNTIYFGRGAYGIEMAAQKYFGISASELDVSQSAMLAGVIPAPSAWDPANDPEKAESRWRGVLRNMVEEGYLDQAEADALTFPETIPMETNSDFEGTNGYLLSTVSSELINSGEFTADDLNTRGLKIVTTIDKDKQQAAVDAVASLPEDRPEKNQVGLVSTDPRTGAIYALYGGKDYMERERNAITQDRAQAGSTFKPFALLAHLEEGGSLRDRYASYSPMSFPGGVSIVNFDESNRGNINLLTATAHSVNTVYVQLNEEVGPSATREVAIRAGIPESTPGLDDALTNVLGSSSPLPLDMARAYGTFANRGVMHEPFIVKEVRDSQGEAIYMGGDEGDRVFEQDDIDTLNYALQEVTAPGSTGETAGLLGRPVAGKTGTSSFIRSAWFIGYIPQMVTVVDMYQIGDNGEEEELTPFGEYWYGIGGGSFPAEIWLNYMQAATADMEIEEFAPLPPDAGNPVRDPGGFAPAPTPSNVPSQEPTQTEEPTEEPTPEPTTEPPAPPEPTEEPTPEPTTEPPAPPEPTENPEQPGDGGDNGGQGGNNGSGGNGSGNGNGGSNDGNPYGVAAWFVPERSAVTSAQRRLPSVPLPV